MRYSEKNLSVLKNNNADIIDYAILTILLLHVMIIRWLSLSGTFNIIIDFLIFITLFKKIPYFIKQKSFIVLLILFLYFLFNFVQCGGQFNILIKNIYNMLTPILIIFYMTHTLFYKKHIVQTYFRKLLMPCNLYMVINIPVLILQLNGHYYLSGLSDSVNSMKQDLICGLFGYNGIPMMTLFFCFLITYNWNYFETHNVKNNKLFVIYNFSLIIFMSIISLFNDNKAFFVLFLFFIIMYLFVSRSDRILYALRKDNLPNLISKYYIHIMVILVVAFLIYQFTGVGDSIQKMISDIILGLTKGNLAQGSNERFGMISLMLNNPDHLRLGYGIAKYAWTQPNALGFVHFGISDFGTFFCLGGLLYIILYISVIYFCIRKQFSKKLVQIVLIAFILILSIYTQIFTITSLIVSVMFFYTVCYL